jgi:hypothetical protein
MGERKTNGWTPDVKMELCRQLLLALSFSLASSLTFNRQQKKTLNNHVWGKIVKNGIM